MADNVTYQSTTPATPPAATVVSTDEGSGGHVQRMKLAYSANGSETHVPADVDGLLVNLGTNNDVSDGGGSLTVDSPQLPAALAAGGGMKIEGVASGVAVPVSAASLPLPSGAATAAKQPALGTAGTASADVISVQGVAAMTALKVDGSAVTQPVSGTVTVQDGSGSITVDAPVGTPLFVRLSDGASSITTLPVSLASVPSHAVTNAGTFAVQVDNTVTVGSHAVTNAGTFAVQVSSALPAGTNAIGKLAANSGVDIGDVDVTSVPADPFGVNADAASATGSISAKLRFIAGTGIPITGTVTVGSHAVTNAGTFAVQAAAAGDVAHDGADSGNPVKVGAKATTGLSGATMVADADRVDARADVDGAIITRPYAPLPDGVSGNASNTDGTSFQVIAAQSSGVRTYITTAILTNRSATDAYVELKDGTTVMATIPIPANGGAVVQFPMPLRGTAATAWNCDPSAALTTVYCTLVGFKSKV